MNCINFTTNSNVNAYPIEEGFDTKYYPENVILFKDGLLDTNTKINFVGTLMTIGNGINTTKSKLDIFVFRNNTNENMIDNLSLASQDLMSTLVARQNQNGSVKDYVNELKEEFNLEMDTSKDYDTNISESIEYITKYNPILLKDAYLSNSKINIEVHGLNCSHCEANVEKVLKELPGVVSVKASAKKSLVVIENTDELDIELVKLEINKAGYSFIKVK